MTRFLLKDSACAAWTSSDFSTSCTNCDEIFNWMSPQSFSLSLNKLHHHAAVFLLHNLYWPVWKQQYSRLGKMFRLANLQKKFLFIFGTISFWEPQMFWQLWGAATVSAKCAAVLDPRVSGGPSDITCHLKHTSNTASEWVLLQWRTVLSDCCQHKSPFSLHYIMSE